MTLGERISAERRAAKISQEALGGIDTSVAVNETVEVADGDAIDLVLHVVDTLGRDQYFLAIGFDIRANERGWLDAEFIDAAQPDYNPADRRK